MKILTDKEISEKAFEWSVDYKKYRDYAQNGFESGYKKAIEENKRGEYIICSAIYINDDKMHDDQPTNIGVGYIISGRRHHNCYATLKAITGNSVMMGKLLIKTNHNNKDQGFITSLNRYVDRKEGLIIAKRENQLLVPSLHEGDEEDILTSEDLFPMDYATMKY